MLRIHLLLFSAPIITLRVILRDGEESAQFARRSVEARSFAYVQDDTRASYLFWGESPPATETVVLFSFFGS